MKNKKNIYMLLPIFLLILIIWLLYAYYNHLFPWWWRGEPTGYEYHRFCNVVDIRNALLEYQKDKNAYPSSLSSLIPDYIHQPSILYGPADAVCNDWLAKTEPLRTSNKHMDKDFAYIYFYPSNQNAILVEKPGIWKTTDGTGTDLVIMFPDSSVDITTKGKRKILGIFIPGDTAPVPVPVKQNSEPEKPVP